MEVNLGSAISNVDPTQIVVSITGLLDKLALLVIAVTGLMTLLQSRRNARTAALVVQQNEKQAQLITHNTNVTQDVAMKVATVAVAVQEMPQVVAENAAVVAADLHEATELKKKVEAT